MALLPTPGQLETNKAKASPAFQPHSHLAYQQHGPWLNQEQGWLWAAVGADAVPSPTVCLFMEESSVGRQHWQQNLALLLQRLATTLRWVLRSQPAPSATWGYLVIKVRAESGRRGMISPCKDCPGAGNDAREGCDTQSLFKWPSLGNHSSFRGEGY